MSECFWLVISNVVKTIIRLGGEELTGMANNNLITFLLENLESCLCDVQLPFRFLGEAGSAAAQNSSQVC